MAVQTGPHDAQDGNGEQDGEGHIHADEGGGEDGGHDVEGRRGGMGQRSEKVGDGAGEGTEHEGAEAERPDVRAGVGVVHVSPPAVCPLYVSFGMRPLMVHSLRPTPARTAARSGSSVNGLGLPSGRQAGVNTMPGAMTSKPSKKRAS